MVFCNVGKFSILRNIFNNILVVVKTGCRKASFVQCLGKNKVIGDGLISVDWVTKINLTKSSKDEIRKCFNFINAEFHYPDNLPDFNLLIETFPKGWFEKCFVKLETAIIEKKFNSKLT